MTARHGTTARGFTLIELMTVVAIVGVLASVAIPEFERMLIRAKTAERAVVMKRIKQGIEDLHLQGRLQPGTDLVGDFNPAGAPGNLRRMPDWSQPGWADVFSSFEEVEGAVCYGYYFHHHEGNTGGPSTLLVVALGDLDGDGVLSTRWDFYLRNSQGSYQQVGRYPATPDLDDTGSF